MFANRFDADGLISEVDLLTASQTNKYRQKLVSFIDRYSDTPTYKEWTYLKSHLLLRWIWELASTPAILDRVEQLLGPDILLWNSFIPTKPPHSKAHFGWHQDATYWPIEPVDQTVNLWLALDHVTPENGCMEMLPGSWQMGQLGHQQTMDPTSMLRRGQQVIEPLDETTARNIILKPGQGAFHGPFTLHRSGANGSDQWRLGVGLNYAAAAVSPKPGYQDSAMLMRGDPGNTRFELETPPLADLDPAAIEQFNHCTQIGQKRYDDVGQKS